MGIKVRMTSVNDPIMQTIPARGKRRFEACQFFDIKYIEKVVSGRHTDVMDRISADLLFIYYFYAMYKKMVILKLFF
jgi:hypothetical protein